VITVEIPLQNVSVQITKARVVEICDARWIRDQQNQYKVLVEAIWSNRSTITPSLRSFLPQMLSGWWAEGLAALPQKPEHCPWPFGLGM